MIAFGESFSINGRIFLISGHSGTTWNSSPVGLELVNDATEWAQRPDLAKATNHRAAFVYNDREDRWLTNCKCCITLYLNNSAFLKKGKLGDPEGRTKAHCLNLTINEFFACLSDLD